MMIKSAVKEEIDKGRDRKREVVRSREKTSEDMGIYG